jgi:hypothetical protein
MAERAGRSVAPGAVFVIARPQPTTGTDIVPTSNSFRNEFLIRRSQLPAVANGEGGAEPQSVRLTANRKWRHSKIL